MSDYYTVVKGDTLGKIAKATGTTKSDLIKLNQISDPNRLEVGQRLALRKEVVTGLQLLFLDWSRDPIAGLEYILEYAGKVIKEVTPANGLGRKVFTDAATDEVRIFVKRLDGTLKEIGCVVSGYGNKLVTLLSPSVKIDGKTEKHPELKPGERPNPNEPIKPAFDPKAKQPPTTDKEDLGLKPKPTTTPDGKPLTTVKGDIPDLSFLGDYVGGEVTKEDIEAAAKDLKCEPGLIYALAKQESAHSSFIKLGNKILPTILYERHQFAKYSKSKFTEKYPDLSGLPYHKTRRVKVVTKGVKGAKDKAEWSVIDVVTGAAPKEDDIYGLPGALQYKRLCKAYLLHQEAALQACSWGKFQIMGFNYGAAGYKNVFDFVKAMCTGEPAHIKAFLRFAKSNKTLLGGLRNLDFEKIAEGHNGEKWKLINPEYSSNIEKFYKEYCGEK